MKKNPLLLFIILISTRKQMGNLNDVIFYSIDRAIKSYRQYAQKRIKAAGYKITVDQWLTLTMLIENPKITQQELAQAVFKDNASITRIIELLIKQELLSKNINEKDRRKSHLRVTQKGFNLKNKVEAIVIENRQNALRNLDNEELIRARKVLDMISHNCNSKG